MFNYRIAEILKRKSRKRLHEARKNERDRIGSDVGTDKSSQPTLPSINVDLDHVQYNDQYSQHSGYQQSGYSQHSYPPQRNIYALQQDRSQDRYV